MINKFITPTNIDGLITALRKKDDKTFIMAGGTDLTIKFREKNIFDFNIINIGKLEDFINIEIYNDIIKIGPSVTMTEIENNKDLQRYMPALVSAAANLGSTQIRNSATIGGNIANAAQCGDTIPVLYAYNARLKILNGLNEYRYENIRDFILDINKTTLKSNEIISAIEIRRTDSIASFAKIGSRKTVTIAKLNCCGIFDINKDNIIEAVEIYMGAVGVRPVKANIIEKILIGKELCAMNYDIKESIEKQIETAIPDRGSKYYKKTAAIGLIEDMLNNVRR